MATKQIMVEPPKDKMTGGLGKSDFKIHEKAYPNSPVYKGELDDAKVTDTYISLVTDAEVNDGGYAFGTVDLNYSGAPDLRTVTVGAGGLPGSPYAPNIVTPAEGMDPASMPNGNEVTNAAQGSGSPFPGNGLANPKDTSLVISGQKVGSLRKGSSTPTG